MTDPTQDKNPPAQPDQGRRDDKAIERMDPDALGRRQGRGYTTRDLTAVRTGIGYQTK